MVFDLPPLAPHPLEDRGRLDPLFAALLADAIQELRLPGERDILALMLLCYFAGTGSKPAVNHVLLEGLNGVAKTTLVKAFARAVAGRALGKFFALTDRKPFTRLQGGPDLTPADVLGFDLLRDGKPIYNAGPFLGVKPSWYFDEINRSPSKTQSCALESMAEAGNVTITTMDDAWRYRRTLRLPAFFLVGSQNPDTQEGTFPLPEAGLDRFMVKVTVQYTGQLTELVAGGEPEFRDDPTGFAEALDRVVQEDLPEMREYARLPENEQKLWLAFPAYLRWARRQKPLGDILTPNLGDPGKAAERLAQEPDGDADVAFADRVEAVLTAARQFRLDTLRDRVRKTPLAAEGPGFIADVVYNTWSDKAYREAVGGLRRGEAVPIPLRRDRRLEDARDGVRQGASPRAAFALRDLARSYAQCIRGGAGTATATADDVRAVGWQVLRHRVFLNYEAAARGTTTDDVTRRVVEVLHDELRGRR